MQHQLTGSISAGYGYTGIVVASLGALTAGGCLLVGLLLGDIAVGAQNASLVLQIPQQMGDIVTAVLLLTVVSCADVAQLQARLAPAAAMNISWLAVVTAMFTIATPLAFGALGAILGERTGVLNLGIEGTMYAGAFGGFLAAEKSGSLWLGIVAAIAVGAAAGALMGLLTVTDRRQPARRRHRRDARPRRRVRLHQPPALQHRHAVPFAEVHPPVRGRRHPLPVPADLRRVPRHRPVAVVGAALDRGRDAHPGGRREPRSRRRRRHLRGAQPATPLSCAVAC